MARKLNDPLDIIPTPEAIRDRLTHTLTLAERLKLLLDLSERVYATTDDRKAQQHREAAHA